MTSQKRHVAIVLAAGASTRMGMQTPKPLLPLAEGYPLILFSLAAFLTQSKIEKVLLACPLKDKPVLEKISSTLNPEFGKKLHLYLGGDSREESVRLGLNEISKSYQDGQSNIFVSIHDGARPFTPKECIDAVLSEVENCMAVTLAVAATDSLKEISEDLQVKQSLDRSRIWQVQTPQAFHLPLLLEAHTLEHVPATDDSVLVEKIHQVKVVKGSKQNYKVTSAEDYEYAVYYSAKKELTDLVTSVL